MAGLTLTKVKSDLDINYEAGTTGIRMAIYTVAFDSSYPTGGEAFDPTTTLATGDTLFSTVYAVLVQDATATGYIIRYDAANKKLQAFWADYDAVADGVLVEVANTTDLSGITAAKAIIFGV